MTKQIKFNSEAREALKKGVDALANAVKVTLGPKGRIVAMENVHGEFHATKDGVTVAKEISLEDRFENMGAQMVKEVASKTNDKAGDGTTTATVLAQAIVKEGLKNVTAGANPMDLKRGIDKAVEAIVDYLSGQAISVGDDVHKIEQVATISANNDPVIGQLIAKAFDRVGKEGVITVEEAQGTETYSEVVEGMQFDKGYLSAYFVTNVEKMKAELNDCYVLITDNSISNLKDLIPVLEAVSSSGKGLLIIAENVDGEALSTLVMNKLRAGFKVTATKCPGFGERKKALLEDIAVLTGGRIISEALGISLSQASIEMLGVAKKVEMDEATTTIVSTGKNSENLDYRCGEIRAQIENASTEGDKVFHQSRLAKLTGGVAVIYVGAVSEVEMKEKKDRVDDALHATRAAVEEGIVPGGGVALLRAKKAVKELKTENEDERTGINIILKAVESPLRTIVENAGLDGSVVVNNVAEGTDDYGFDAKRNEYVQMIEAGIIDPKKVTRVALENAASVAGMVLVTECLMVNQLPKTPKFT